MKKPSAISPGYIKKVFALEVKPATSLRGEMKVGERKVPKRQKIMPLTVQQLIMKRVYLAVKPNITWLLVLSSRMRLAILAMSYVLERITQSIARNQMVQPATNAE